MPEPGTAGFVQSCGTGAAILRALLYKILEGSGIPGIVRCRMSLVRRAGIGVHSPKKTV